MKPQIFTDKHEFKIMRVTIKIIFVFIISIFCSFGLHAQNPVCEQVKDDEITRQGCSETVVYKLKGTFQSIQGTAVLNSETEPLETVFVELFPSKSDKRIVACRTNQTGKFSFPNVPDGKYIIRLSKDGGFAISEIQIKVSAKSKNTNEVVGRIHLGT